MNDKRIETDFEKLKYYLDIDTYYDELSEFKNLLYELFGDRVESQKYIVRINKKCNQLQSNWNSLREFVNDWIEELENQRESVEGTDLFENHTLVILDNIKTRINELEGKDKK